MYEQSEMCFITQHPRVSVHRLSVCDLASDCPVTVCVFVAEKMVTARMTDALLVCWGLFVSVAITTARLEWQRRCASVGRCVIHGQFGRRCRAKAWQRSSEEPGRKHLVDLQVLTKFGLSFSCCHPQCTSTCRTHCTDRNYWLLML